MRVLAVDPGYERMGIAVVSSEKGRGKEEVLFSSCVTTEKSETFISRLGVATQEFNRVRDEWKPDCVALEKLFWNKSRTSALHVAEMRGAILSASQSAGLPVYEYTPSQIKVAVTGSGSANKKQIEDMVKRLVAISHTPKYDDEYDAIACALTCLAIEKEPKKE